VIGQLAALISEIGVTVTEFPPTTPTRVLQSTAV